MWQDDAFLEWREKLEERLDPAYRAVIQALEPSRQIQWLRGLGRTPHPVAQGIAQWLSAQDSRGWTAVAADGWDLAESERLVLLAYPEHLGHDPLAMCAMGALWAQDDPDRWSRLVSFLGPVVVLGAKEGGWDSQALADRLPGFVRAYPEAFRDWGIEIPLHAEDRDENWPALPDYRSYQEQLRFGVVPHEPGGEGIQSENAVLLALAMMPDTHRALAAGLSYKALEGRWLLQAWQGGY